MVTWRSTAPSAPPAITSTTPSAPPAITLTTPSAPPATPTCPGTPTPPPVEVGVGLFAVARGASGEGRRVWGRG